MTEEKKLKVIFAPGCFDSFDGTQEELDELVQSINQMVENPDELMANSREVNLDELDDELLEVLGSQLEKIMDDSDRKLH